jgi:hypothetical protein
MSGTSAPAPARPTREAVERLMWKLRLKTPVVTVYDAEPTDAFAPLGEPDPDMCCFAFYDRWVAGETLVLRKGGGGCKGAFRATGLDTSGDAKILAHMLTDGVGAPKKEGLRADAELALAHLQAGTPPQPRTGYVLVGPFRLDQWDSVRSLTFLVDPDRLAALMTLAGYWSADDVVAAPFGSGCSFLWKALGAEDGKGPLAIIGGTDVAMRRFLPTAILTLTVGPAHFAKMLTAPEGSFLDLDWWNDLMDTRGRWA